MKLKDLLTSLRAEILDDAVKPYLWSDEVLTRYLNNAVREACIRARLLRDDAAGNPALCRLDVDPAAEGRVAYNAAILAIRSASLSTGAHPLRCVSSNDMDRREPGWDAGRREIGEPHYAVLDLRQKVLQLWPAPVAPVVLQLRVWRAPLESEQMRGPDDEPVIKIPDHEELRHWAAHEAYLKKDADTADADAAGTHLALFEQRFGERPSLHAMARWADSPPRIRNANMF